MEVRKAWEKNGHFIIFILIVILGYMIAFASTVYAVAENDTIDEETTFSNGTCFVPVLTDINISDITFTVNDTGVYLNTTELFTWFDECVGSGPATTELPYTAIVLSLVFASFIFAYISTFFRDEKFGIIKLLFLSASAINVWVAINVSAKVADIASYSGIATTIMENSNVIFLVVLYAAGIWMFALFIIWVLNMVLKSVGFIKEPKP